MLVEIWSNSPSNVIIHQGLKTKQEMMKYMVQRAEAEQDKKGVEYNDNGMTVVLTNGVKINFIIGRVV